MQEFIAVECKSRNNKKYYLISNYSNSYDYSESDLRSKMRNRYIHINNIIIDNTNNIRIIPPTTDIKNDKEFFYLYLSDRVTFCPSDYDIMYSFVSKMRTINHRKITFDSDIEVVKYCINMLEMFFKYMGIVEFKYFNHKCKETMFIDETFRKHFRNTYQMDMNVLFDEFKSDGTLVNWIDTNGNINFNLENINAYSFKDILRILKYLSNRVYSDKKKKQVTLSLNILNDFFKFVKYNEVAGFLYRNYLLTLSDNCLKRLETHNPVCFPVNVNLREVLEKTAGITNKKYLENVNKIKANSRKLNQLVNSYNSDTKAILNCVKNNMTVDTLDIKRLEDYLTVHMNEIHNLYDEIVGKLKGNIEGKRGKKVIEVVGSVQDMSQFCDLKIVPDFNILENVNNLLLGSIETIKRGYDAALNDCLSSDSREIYNLYCSLSKGKKGTLLYILDRVRWNSSLNIKFRRKELHWYSDSGVQPLLNLFTKEEDFLLPNGLKHELDSKDRKEVEISWLTTYYIMVDKIDNNMLFVRNNNGYISWELFEKCFCMRLPTYKFENLRYFKGYLDMECKWDLHKNIKLNIYRLLKDNERIKRN